jgi:hypothetical protein
MIPQFLKAVQLGRNLNRDFFERAYCWVTAAIPTLHFFSFLIMIQFEGYKVFYATCML